MRRLSVAVTWEKSNQGLNLPVVCVSRQKETQFDSKGREKIYKMDDDLRRKLLIEGEMKMTFKIGHIYD